MLKAEQGDREAAWRFCPGNSLAGQDRDGWMSGVYDDAIAIQTFAKHREDTALPLREALEWYAEQVAGCRKLGRIGDPFRNALNDDGGERARKALHPDRGE